MSRRLIASIITLLVAASLTLMSGPAVLAAPKKPLPGNANVYIVTPKYTGFCPDVLGFGKNRVKRIKYVSRTDQFYQIEVGKGARNSDIAYPRVILNQTIILELTVQCRFSLPHELTVSFTPTKHQQTFIITVNGDVIS